MAFLYHTLTQLGPAYAGLEGTIGYRVLSQDGATILSAFTTTGVTESANLPHGGVGGDYVVPAGVSLPDSTPVLIQWGNGTSWYSEEAVDIVPPIFFGTLSEDSLTLDWTLISGPVPDRCMLQALRAIRNKWAISGVTQTVYEEDDATSAWETTLSSSASADPVTGSDPT